MTNFINITRNEITNILKKNDNRLLCIIGPCSIHNIDEALESLLKTIDEYGLSPIKLYEYMAAGRPIIASDIDDINIVDGLGIGAIVPMPLEREALKETISRFLSMPADQLDAMGQRARDILCERFTWDKRGDQILGWVHENLS